MARMQTLTQPSDGLPVQNFLVISELNLFGLKLSHERTNQQELQRRLLTVNSLSGVPCTVVFENRQELAAKNQKECLTAQACYKSDTPLGSRKINGLAEQALQIVKRSREVSIKLFECYLATYIERMFCSVIKTGQMIELDEVHGWSFCSGEAHWTRGFEPRILWFWSKNKYQQSTTNHGIWTASSGSKKWSILAIDGQMATIRITTEIKIEPPPNNGNTITEIQLPPVLFQFDNFNLVPRRIEPYPNGSRRKTEAEPNVNSKIPC